MRISIREQLGLLVLFCSLSSLMVLALAVWFQNYNFIKSIRLSGLSLTASLKAAQVSSALLLYESQVTSVSTRVLIQSALGRYYAGNDSAENWGRSQTDLQGALGDGSLLVQAVIFPNAYDGNQTAVNGLVNVTAGDLPPVKLPNTYPNGTDIYLGDPDQGYPAMLYPNLTYGDTIPGTNYSNVSYEGQSIEPGNPLFIGPMAINGSYSLLSVTVAMINNTSRSDVLGWLTVLVNCDLLYNVRDSPEGLGSTGETLLVGPATNTNHFKPEIRGSDSGQDEDQSVRFVFPPQSNSTLGNRHQARASLANATLSFPMSSYPAVLAAWTKRSTAINNAGAFISTNNEEGAGISAGYATISNSLVDWVLIVEQSHEEVIAPINHLRNVVLICVFSVTGLLLLVMFPLAHYSITPIRQLYIATAKAVEPYQPDDNSSEYSSSVGAQPATEVEEGDGAGDDTLARKEGFFGALTKITKPMQASRSSTPRTRRRTFRIPRKVPERRHCVTDELTELTRTFNEMSDELAMQYERLEERVKQRTAELEKSKKAAEAANESKTLFIANISHELKTPLNGILGLTTVCMNEDDVGRIRSTLNTIYKSGDLLLHLLTDLLTFSKNEVGQQLSIDETEFRLSDLSTQLLPTFEKQAREAQVDLKVLFLGTSDAFGDSSDFAGNKLYGPGGTGRVRDMCLWGDKNRILQVLMNFVSNSLKFTPPHGSVTVSVRCTGILDNDLSRAGSARKSSLASRKSKSSTTKRVRMSDSSLAPGDTEDQERNRHHNSGSNEDSKLSINVAGGTTQIHKVVERQRSMSPPPINTKDLAFEFEVEDTGPGIPPDQQKKIFEPFVQGDLGLSKKYGGTGLGLSICAQLAALMGGDISLDSTVGVGSKFTMRIPLRYVSERTPSLSSTHRSHSKASSLVGQTLHAGGTTQIHKVVERQRSMSPPPINTKDLAFEFEVEDTGPGIPPDQQKKIFEPFVQGDLGLSKKYGGTGLGLSICAQLAALMGGDISLDSTVGVGSKFTMRIPLRYVSERTPSLSSTHRSHSKASSLVGQTLHDTGDAPLHHNGSTTSLGSTRENSLADVPRIVGFTQPYVAKENKKKESQEAKLHEMKKAENEAVQKGRKVRVLVAEDNKVNQEVVLRMLRLEDVYDVTIAKDGQEAFDKVRESMHGGARFDLVFMDVQMPNLDGIQSTKLIREMGFSAPIVALTAFAEKSNEDECMASGMDYFLAKPIRRPALKQVLKKYCATIPEEENEGSTTAVPRSHTSGGVNGHLAESPKARPSNVQLIDPDGVSPLS
ncbi:Histidine kinase osmosensor [Exophiala xenobiotica]|nr:Histidine kinase osmosensor [Exophiala xenobiotica]